jgi:hypothetical protein
MRILRPADVRVGSNSAVSRFLRHGCFAPETGHWLARLALPKSATTGLMHRSKPSLFDHLVSDREHARQNCQAQCLGGLEVDHQLKLGGL